MTRKDSRGARHQRAFLIINNNIVECLPRARKGTYADDRSRVRHVSVRLNTAHFALSTWLLANRSQLLLHIFEYKSGAATGNNEILKSSDIFLPQLDSSANCRQLEYFKLNYILQPTLHLLHLHINESFFRLKLNLDVTYWGRTKNPPWSFLSKSIDSTSPNTCAGSNFARRHRIYRIVNHKSVYRPQLLHDASVRSNSALYYHCNICVRMKLLQSRCANCQKSVYLCHTGYWMPRFFGFLQSIESFHEINYLL